MAPPRRFSYYDRLSAKDKATYRTSDEITAVHIPDPAALAACSKAIEMALFSGVRVRVAKAVVAFVDAFCTQIFAPAVKVHVREVRPDLESAELHGLYTFRTEDSPPKLEVWMRTRAHEKVVKHRTFMRTLVHELCHHIDMEVIGLEESFHTQGFFRRESSIVRQILDPKKESPPRPTQRSLFE
ncbi:MAG: hypothetical protein JST00_13325 [Deltaproteobacteria bacterium]|nr:hypothetical protein [Deltaproteobacteria bacterium]